MISCAWRELYPERLFVIEEPVERPSRRPRPFASPRNAVESIIYQPARVVSSSLPKTGAVDLR